MCGFQANFSDWWLRCISCAIVLSDITDNITDNKSTLVQVMAWCRQATSHYLSQCWPRLLSPYDITRPQWVKDINYLVTYMRYHFPSPFHMSKATTGGCWWPGAKVPGHQHHQYQLNSYCNSVWVSPVSWLSIQSIVETVIVLSSMSFCSNCNMNSWRMFQ